MVTMVKVKCIALKHYTMTLTGLEPRPLGLETSALTTGHYDLPGSHTTPTNFSPVMSFTFKFGKRIVRKRVCTSIFA